MRNANHGWLFVGFFIIDFSNVLGKQQIEEMAQADEYEVVKEVQVRLLFLSCLSFRRCVCGLFG
jgi:hypothetical protein